MMDNSPFSEPDPYQPSSRLGRSTEDISLRTRPEYRGPLLQKFHDGEFKSKTDLQNVPYPPVAPGEAGKVTLISCFCRVCLVCCILALCPFPYRSSNVCSKRPRGNLPLTDTETLSPVSTAGVGMFPLPTWKQMWTRDARILLRVPLG